MKQRRLVVIGGGLIILLLIWVFTHQGEDDVLQSHQITGVIKEFHAKRPPQKSATANRTSPSRQAGQISIAIVELNADKIAEGGYARIMVPKNKYAEGDVLPLVLKLYKNGTKKVELVRDNSSANKKSD